MAAPRDVCLPPAGFWGTNLISAIKPFALITFNPESRLVRDAILPKWGNMSNTATTSGSAGTSGGAGTTVIAAGNYTWIG